MEQTAIPLTTTQVARLLNLTARQLRYAIWECQIEPPTKLASGAYIWFAPDIRRASWALLGRAPDLTYLMDGKEDDAQHT